MSLRGTLVTARSHSHLWGGASDGDRLASKTDRLQRGERSPQQELAAILLPSQADDVLELDELWSFVGCQENQVWIWIALCRRTRQVVAWMWGDHSSGPCSHLSGKVPTAYQQCHCFAGRVPLYGLSVGGEVDFGLNFPRQNVQKDRSHTERRQTNSGGSWMNDRKRYTSEFKREAVRLLNEGGVSLSAVSLQLGVHRSLLGQWKRQHQREAQVASSGSGDEKYTAFLGQGRPHEEELARLRRENAALRMERDVLKKTIVIFAEPGAKSPLRRSTSLFISSGNNGP